MRKFAYDYDLDQIVICPVCKKKRKAREMCCGASICVHCRDTEETANKEKRGNVK